MKLLLPLAGFALAIAACTPAGTTSGSPSAGSQGNTNVDQSMTASPSAEATDLDRAFIDMMVPHHESAIEMAKIAQERAEHQELRDMAVEIVKAQEGEISDLREWRNAWFGSPNTPSMNEMPLMPGMEMPGMPGMSGGTMDMTADIEELETAEPFDDAFIDAMTEHHESAIEAAMLIRDATALPELKALADSIISSQQAEIDQMAEWRAAWY